MRNILHHIALFMAFLMLMTSCYTYQRVPTATYDMQMDDKVKITTRGIDIEGRVTSVNDSTVIIRQGNRGADYFSNTIRFDDVDWLYVKQYDKQKTIWSIILPTMAVALVALIIGTVGLGKWANDNNKI